MKKRRSQEGEERDLYRYSQVPDEERKVQYQLKRDLMSHRKKRANKKKCV